MLAQQRRPHDVDVVQQWVELDDLSTSVPAPCRRSVWSFQMIGVM
ncbi:MAG: hypothetical protein QM805_04295 [Pseudomonas sp.]